MNHHVILLVDRVLACSVVASVEHVGQGVVSLLEADCDERISRRVDRFVENVFAVIDLRSNSILVLWSLTVCVERHTDRI